jgi:MoxR-like ATPase
VLCTWPDGLRSMSRRLLLITGIPGTGKTTMGKHLEAHHGFLHVDREVHRPPEFSADSKGFVAATRRDVVATWGFRPMAPEDLAGVDELRQLGFVGVWLDGYRPWALTHFLAAKPEKEAEFYLQMLNVTTSGIVATLGFPR